MNFRSNKTKPQPFPKNLETAQPATKVKLEPVLLELIGNVTEKKVDKSNKMKISDFDVFGEPIKLNWNKSDSYKTKTGVVFTAIYVVTL